MENVFRFLFTLFLGYGLYGVFGFEATIIILACMILYRVTI